LVASGQHLCWTGTSQRGWWPRPTIQGLRLGCETHMPRSHRGFNTLKVLDSKGGPLKREVQGRQKSPQAEAEGRGQSSHREGWGEKFFGIWSLDSTLTMTLAHFRAGLNCNPRMI